MSAWSKQLIQLHGTTTCISLWFQVFIQWLPYMYTCTQYTRLYMVYSGRITPSIQRMKSYSNVTSLVFPPIILNVTVSPYRLLWMTVIGGEYTHV